MNLLIFALTETDWAFATPDALALTLPPFAIDGAFLSYRLWRDGNASDAQWEAAKTFFLRLAGDLRKPGRRVRKVAA